MCKRRLDIYIQKLSFLLPTKKDKKQHFNAKIGAKKETRIKEYFVVMPLSALILANYKLNHLLTNITDL